MWRIVSIILIVINPVLIFGQSMDEEKISNSFFMPSIQMGYINNQSNELSGGIFIQTSIEHKTSIGTFIRINYDNFNSDCELTNTKSPNITIKDKVSFSELVGGIGYRKTFNRHNFLLLAQTGSRFYGIPFIEINESGSSIKTDNKSIQINRYTLGYEYEIAKRVFLSYELFASHVWVKQNYWKEYTWSSGFTIGIITTIY